nr:unnamed protein product [Callosobruchus chinensis]
MHSQQKQKNPWNRNNSRGNSTPNQRKGGNSNNDPTPSEDKFKRAQSKLQAAVQKHIEEYESSSEEEEEVQSSNLIEKILKNYTSSYGEQDNIGRTQNFLEQAFTAGASTCLICISRVKRDDQVWSCTNCFAPFHLLCIQRWSKDTLTQQKQALEEQTAPKGKQLAWCCPKCRQEYEVDQVPKKYLCFCGKKENPKYDPYLVPHSCGEMCKKNLVPNCGHKCLLLCHPGPCPPCPATVSVTCYCESQAPQTRRCSNREWSCGNKCGKLLSCNKHSCSEPCHPGGCKPCPKKSIQRCICKSEQKLRDCAEPIWQCNKVCNKSFSCGHHKCEKVCHDGACGDCPLTDLRTCPCGKQVFQLPCTQETPSCQDTCEKVLECGIHTCNERCHKDKCGLCLETVVKSCRCGLHSKEVQCCKPYFCETKCKRMRDCNKHPCNRKCCDGSCPPCEKPCGRTLSCGNHKCNSVCHQGPCYPCSQTDVVTCRCGSTKIQVPCGRKHKTKPPRCNKPCMIPPDCHHPKRGPHRCHFGECPPCKQVCGKSHPDCSHTCPAPCHSAVLMKEETQKASMPWEQTKPQLKRVELPCPECVVPVPVTCLGQHETVDWPCHLAKPSSCQRPCGRILSCTNHTCTLPCHSVVGATDTTKAGENCEQCDNPCLKDRPEGCQHECPDPCHPGVCKPCKQMVRIKCHCGLNQLYVTCADWMDPAKRDQLQCCGNQCPKNYECGHRCKADCHPGSCPNAEQCKKKVKMTCKCKRIKKEFSCEFVRTKQAKVECHAICKEKKEEERLKREKIEQQKKLEEEEKNKKELEKYLKMFDGKKKGKVKEMQEEAKTTGFFGKYKVIISSCVILVIATWFLNYR